jgi:ABC-type uncharacterized transport system auxiliary subunit
MAPVALGLLMLPRSGVRRIRRRLGKQWLIALFLVTGTALAAGLGGCGTTARDKQTYNFALTATAGTVQHKIDLTLNLK